MSHIIQYNTHVIHSYNNTGIIQFQYFWKSTRRDETNTYNVRFSHNPVSFDWKQKTEDVLYIPSWFLNIYNYILIWHI